MSDNNQMKDKAVNVDQFSDMFHAALVNKVPFSEAIQINMDAKLLLTNMMTVPKALSDKTKDLINHFEACNTDGTHGLYQGPVRDELYVSGHTLNALVQILIGNSDKANSNAASILAALASSFDKADNYKPFIAYQDGQTVETDNGQVQATIKPIKF